MPGEMTTWLRVQDVRNLIREFRQEVAHLSGHHAPHADSAAQMMIDQLEKHLEWFIQAAEERDQLKSRCDDCGKVIGAGTGLEKAGKLIPLCPPCQAVRAMEGA